MKRNLKILGLLFSAMIIFAGCEEDARPYGDATPIGNTSVVFSEGSMNLELSKTDPYGVAHDLTSTIYVKFFGAPLANNANITIEVLDSSTAVEGEHFDFSASSIVIPAGEIAGSLGIEVYNGYPYDEITGESINGGLPLEEKKVLYLKLGGDVPAYYTSEIMTIELYEKDFCAVKMANIVGTWSGTDEDTKTGSASVSAEIEQIDETTFVIKANSGVPVFCNATWMSWGEVFQAGIGNEGDVIFTVDLEGNLTTEKEAYWGQTLPGPYDYKSTATGQYISCEDKMVIDFVMDNGWITSHTVLTKD